MYICYHIIIHLILYFRINSFNYNEFWVHSFRSYFFNWRSSHGFSGAGLHVSSATRQVTCGHTWQEFGLEPCSGFVLVVRMIPYLFTQSHPIILQPACSSQSQAFLCLCALFAFYEVKTIFNYHDVFFGVSGKILYTHHKHHANHQNEQKSSCETHVA